MYPVGQEARITKRIMKKISHSHRRSQGVERGCIEMINMVSLEKKEAESSKNAPSLRKKGETPAVHQLARWLPAVTENLTGG